MSKQDKLMLLYDHEPSNEMLAVNLNAIVGRAAGEPSAVNYRLDGGVKRELFLNYWKARLNRFDFNLERNLDDTTPGLNGTGYTYSNHHLSNRDIGGSNARRRPNLNRWLIYIMCFRIDRQGLAQQLSDVESNHGDKFVGPNGFYVDRQLGGK